jgi:hypothetical protein
MTDVRPMNFAERVVAGPPVLRTTDRRAAVGDLVWFTEDSMVYRVTEVFAAIVGARPGYAGTSLLYGEPALMSFRQGVTLTKAEAKEAEAFYAEQRKWV